MTPINFNQLFPAAQGKKPAPICGHCEGRGVIPAQNGKVETCHKCLGTGKEEK